MTPDGTMRVEGHDHTEFMAHWQRTAPSRPDPATACAVWYEQGNGVDYNIDDSESEAADCAVILENGDWPADILGVQFSDGRAIPARDWAALTEARERARQREASGSRWTPPPPTRTVGNPFSGEPVEVDADAPEWLGRP